MKNKHELENKKLLMKCEICNKEIQEDIHYMGVSFLVCSNPECRSKIFDKKYRGEII